MTQALGTQIGSITCAIALISVIAAQHVLAAPLGGPGVVRPLADAPDLLNKVHGFHCRSELGWDPTTGTYRYHRHEGICNDYQGCLRAQQACIFWLGRGLDIWRYERWGRDNWRYTSCMMRRGCY